MAPTISSRRVQLARNLARTIGNDFVVVPAPDHPLLMRSVDVLIGGPAGLVAIMMRTAEEARRPSLFEARVLLNKMALPPHTVFVRLTNENESSGASDKLFAAEFSLKDRSARNDLAKLATKPPASRQVERAEENQRRSEARFADTYRLTRVLNRRVKSQTESKGTSRAPSFDRIGGEIEAAYFDGKPSPAAVSSLMLRNADRWYHIFEGEVEPINSPASAMFVETYPQVRGDPDKILRASAFAGWVVSPLVSSNPQLDVAGLLQRYTGLK